jgi:hypothetical protein
MGMTAEISSEAIIKKDSFASRVIVSVLVFWVVVGDKSDSFFLGAQARRLICHSIKGEEL